MLKHKGLWTSCNGARASLDRGSSRKQHCSPDVSSGLALAKDPALRYHKSLIVTFPDIAQDASVCYYFYLTLHPDDDGN